MFPFLGESGGSGAHCQQVQRSPLIWLFPSCPCFPVMRRLSCVTEIRVRLTLYSHLQRPNFPRQLR